MQRLGRRAEVLHPDGTVAQEGTHSIREPHYAASYAFGSYALPVGARPGRWTVAVDHEGVRYTHGFLVSPRKK